MFEEIQTAGAYHAKHFNPWGCLEVDEQKTIGIDFDETISDNPAVWTFVMKALEQAGYRVVVVTWRYPTSWPEELQFLVDKGYKIYYTSREAKDDYMKQKHGIKVHIWIDDNPFAILNDAPNKDKEYTYSDGRVEGPN